MKNKEFLFFLAVGLLIYMAMPADVFATTGRYTNTGLEAEAEHLSGFLFGPPIRIAGLLGGVYGLIQSIFSSSITPLLIYGGLGLGANMMPQIVKVLFPATTMLLP